jgi:hypothetical protein
MTTNEMPRAEILKPAKHGFVVDLFDGPRRVQVRVFEFEQQQLAPGVECEMPVLIDEGHAIARLRQGMEAMRERSFAESIGQSDSRAIRQSDKDEGIIPYVPEYDQKLCAERQQRAWGFRLDHWTMRRPDKEKGVRRECDLEHGSGDVCGARLSRADVAAGAAEDGSMERAGAAD